MGESKINPSEGIYIRFAASLNIDNNGMDMVSMSANFSNLGLINPSLPTITSTPAANGSLISVCVPNGTSGSANLTASSSMTATYTWKLVGVYIPNTTGNTYTQVVTPTNNYKNVSVEAIYS